MNYRGLYLSGFPRETELVGVVGSPVTFAVHSFCPYLIMMNYMYAYVCIHIYGERERD